MKKQKVTLRSACGFTALIGVAALLAACAPVFSDLQSARLVGPGKIEATPGFSSVSVMDEGQTEHIQNHFGIQAGVGVLSFLDFRLRYERVIVDGNGSDSFGLNVFGFGPKIGLLKDRIAFYVPVGFAFGEDIEVSETWEIHPTLIATIPFSRSIELNPSAKVLIPFKGERDTLVAFNLGAALGKDVRKWAIRPEVGLCFNPGEGGYFWQVSLGFSLATN
jgi:hypothetical protein